MGNSETSVTPDEPIAVLTVAARLKRTGIEKKLLIDNTDNKLRARSDVNLPKLLARAHELQTTFLAGGKPISELAKQAGISGSYYTRLLRLSFLVPDMTRAMLRGRHPADLTVAKLMADTRVPIDWQEQYEKLRFS